MSYRSWLDISDVVNRIRNTSVFGNIGASEIYNTFIIHNYVLEDSAFFDSCEDFRFFFSGKVYYFSVATTFEVEYGIFRSPTVFVITDEVAVRIGRKGSFTSSRKTEEDSSIAVFTYVSRTVHWHSVAEYRQFKVHSREDTFFNFAGITSTTDKGDFFSKIKDCEVSLTSAIYSWVGFETRSINN